MSGGVFVLCPGCDRLMIGHQGRDGHVYPQPHQCQEKQ